MTIRYLDEEIKYRSNVRCPICGSLSSSQSIELMYEGSPLRMHRCVCGSLFYPNRFAPDYGKAEGEDSFWMRIDQAEGIDSVLRPLLVSRRLNHLPVIDIGCGMGFSADFIRSQGRSCQAFDPSAAAVMSSRILGIEIVHGLADIMSIRGQEPRLVFASEVI